MTTRNYEYVPYKDIEPLLNLLKQGGFTEGQIATNIGYSSATVFSVARTEQKTRLAVKMALLGLLSCTGEKATGNGKTTFVLTYNQAELLFSALRAYRKAAPGRDDEIKPLLAAVSTEMVRLA